MAKNKNKNGRRFKYADSMFETLALIKSCTGISYRVCEGIARGILDDAPDHTTICMRINALDVTLNYDEHAYRTDNDCTMLTVDSSGLQLNDRGEWIREKWNVRRGFIKIHFLVEIKTRKILAFRVTTDRKGDGQQLSCLLEDVKDVLGKRSVLYGDGGYDSKGNFNYCHRLGVDARIKVCINSGLKAGGFARNSTVRDKLGGRKDRQRIMHICKDKMIHNRTERKKRVHYGQRWISEVVFSAFKKIFGNSVYSKKWDNIVQEIRIKVSAYNTFCNIA